MTDRDPHGSGAKGPDELRQQIEESRSRPADGADVKGRARARAADLRDRAGAMTVQLRESAAHAGHDVQDRAARAGHGAQERMTRAGHLVQERAAERGHSLQDRAARAGRTVADDQRVPRPVRSAVDAALRHPGPALIAGAAGAAVVAGAVVGFRAVRHG
ncbi:circumsporozoite protein [Streptomyces sp. NPDC100445]|uniref:circumsporozoite protein n=1 Tax=Streptomyces sp. NPDC100445 TaxID=3366102 RepID=UPI00380C31D3